eukprot:scaffold37163_cov70-Phaeocystis_antarctica.AAC.2
MFLVRWITIRAPSVPGSGSKHEHPYASPEARLKLETDDARIIIETVRAQQPDLRQHSHAVDDKAVQGSPLLRCESGESPHSGQPDGKPSAISGGQPDKGTVPVPAALPAAVTGG